MINSYRRLYPPFIYRLFLSKGISYEEKSWYYYIPAEKMSKKIVVKAQLNCEKCKKRAMETVAGLEGVVSVEANLNDQKITVIGDTDAVCLTASLRKLGHAELVSVGPSKEPEKKPEAKKPDDKKEEKKPAQKQEPANHTYVILPTCCHHYSDYTYYLSDENPNSCCIV